LKQNAEELIDRKLPTLAGGKLGGSWHDWLIAEILRREAEKMFSKRGSRTGLEDASP
jgi:hypothetical protein